MLAYARPPIQAVDHLVGDGARMFEMAVAAGAEGIVSKHVDRAWRSGRNRHWLKIKGQREDIFVVGGVTKSDRRALASLVLGEWRNGQLVYRGRVGTGFSDRQLTLLNARLGRLTTDASPFAELPTDMRREVTWVRPEMAVSVSYAGVTSSGQLWHPKFLGLATMPPRIGTVPWLPRPPNPPRG